MTWPLLALGSLTSLTTLLAACGSGGVSPDDDQAAVDASGPDATATDGAIGGDPVGEWALRRVLATTADAPIVGATTTSRVTITADGAAFPMIDDVCGVALESSSALAVPSLHPDYPATIATKTVTATLSGGNLVVPLGIDVTGAELGDPDGDPLPTDPDDDVVRDEDGDGDPGLTVYLQVTGLGVVEVYVAQRSESTLRSTSLGDDRISGALEMARFEQSTLGASNQLFAGQNAIGVEDDASRFVLARVDAAWTCADVLAQDELTLFGPR